MNAQQTFTDIEYGSRKGITKRDLFLARIDALVPWDEWINTVRPFYPEKNHGRPSRPLEIMLRMWLLRSLYSLTDSSVEDEINDSYAMRTFLKVNFMSEQVPDAVTLLKFRNILKKHGLDKQLTSSLEKLFTDSRVTVRKGKIKEASCRKWGGRPPRSKT